jgi:polyamine oxidase
LGAEWIHHLPTVLNRLKGKSGDQVDEETVPYNTFYKFDKDFGSSSYGKIFSWLNSSVMRLLFFFRFKFFPEFKFKNSTWYSFIDKNFAEEVKDKIEFNSPVTQIDYSKDKVDVVTKSGQIYKADKVLVTASIGVLKSEYINFIPDLGKEKQDAIESLTFMPGFKLVMKFSEKFYSDIIMCKAQTGEKGYYDMAFKKDSKNQILGLLVQGSGVEDFYCLESEEQIVLKALEELDKIYEGKASKTYTGEYIFEDWGRHEFTLGTWIESFQINQSIIQKLNEPLNGKIFFAGELYDLHHQLGVPGAIVSGYHSIDKLLTNL